MSFDREKVKQQAARLAAKGVFIGTSSWKYPGWVGMIYDEQRYLTRGKLSERKLEDNCLPEYAQVFKTVCVDGAYYKFPTSDYLGRLIADVPEDFQFAFKVTEEITVKRFPNLPKSGIRAGRPNNNFLNADLFATAFLKPCEEFRKNIGLLMFEFSRFSPADYSHGREFVADLDRFLEALPKGWPYGIELRNKEWLQPEYLACLARHGVTHVFNNWDAMPPIIEQLGISGTRPNENLVAARFLLKPGRKYQQAVDSFQPYARVQEVNEDARKAAAAIIVEGERSEPRRKTFIYINNRLEGNALGTISGVFEMLD